MLKQLMFMNPRRVSNRMLKLDKSLLLVMSLSLFRLNRQN